MSTEPKLVPTQRVGAVTKSVEEKILKHIIFSLKNRHLSYYNKNKTKNYFNEIICITLFFDVTNQQQYNKNNHLQKLYV